jgi:hypothetical protein
MGILAVGFASTFSNMFKNSKAVDLKGQTQDFATEVRLAITSPNACSIALGLRAGDTPAVSPFLASQAPAAGSFLQLPVSSLNLGGSTYAVGTAYQDMKVKSLLLVLPHEIEPNSYVATFQVSLERKSGVNASGPSVYGDSFPVLLTTETDPSNSSKLRIKSCYADSEFKAEKGCAELGGRWLTGDNVNYFMPKSRCNMTKDIELAVNEAPKYDGGAVPLVGESNSDGERVSECYYQASGSDSSLGIQTFICSGRTGGWRCAFNKNERQWKVVKINSSGAVTKTKRLCDKGVTVSTRQEGTTNLDWFEDINQAFDASDANLNFSGSALIEAKREFMTTVSRCHTDPLQETWNTCTNTSQEAAAIEGAPNSCQFVSGVKLTGDSTSAKVARYNSTKDADMPTMDKNSYTGWVYVSKKRTVKAGTPKVAEATGIPCFEVEINQALEPHLVDSSDGGSAWLTPAFDPGGTTSPTLTTAPTGSTVTPWNQPWNVARCLFSKSDDAAPHQAFMCKNGVSQVFKSGILSTLKTAAGACWYVNNTYISGYYPKGTGKPKYSGWVYMQGDFPTSMTIDSTYAMKPKSGKNPQLSALPCEQGVRMYSGDRLLDGDTTEEDDDD